MMSKRILLILLFVGGMIAIILVLVWLFPSLRRGSSSLAPTSQGILRQGQPAPRPSPQGSLGGTAPAPALPVMTPAERERQAQETLKQQAMIFAARQGTYANADGFAAMRTVYVDATPSVQAYLEVERQKLIKAHPTSGPSWGQTSRALSARLISGAPVLSGTSAEVAVQIQQTVESADANPVIQYQEVILAFQKEGNRWIVSRVSSQPLAL